jgi:hypothetical protein
LNNTPKQGAAILSVVLYLPWVPGGAVVVGFEELYFCYKWYFLAGVGILY